MTGRDAKATTRVYYEALEAPLDVGFTNEVDLAPAAFSGHDVLQIEFTTEVVLPDSG